MSRRQAFIGWLLFACICISVVLGPILWYHGYIGSLRTQLVRCAHSGNWSRLVRLVGKCPDVDSIADSYGQTLLTLACYYSEQKIMNIL